MFAGVEYMEAPRHLPDLEVEEPRDEDVARAEDRLGKTLERQNVIVLSSRGRRYLVVAAMAMVVDTEMEIFDTPFDLA
jgi:hypothetical protein